MPESDGHTEARSVYERVLGEYADQTEVRAQARDRLAALAPRRGAVTPSTTVVRRVWTGPDVDLNGMPGRYFTFTGQRERDSLLTVSSELGGFFKIRRKTHPLDPPNPLNARSEPPNQPQRVSAIFLVGFGTEPSWLPRGEKRQPDHELDDDRPRRRASRNCRSAMSDARSVCFVRISVAVPAIGTGTPSISTVSVSATASS